MTMSEVSPEKDTPKLGEIDNSSANSPPSDQTLANNNHQTDSPQDVEKQSDPETAAGFEQKKQSAFKSLGILDRFLALWIFLAMLIGILLGNFVENVGPALQKGKFVQVSIPIGKL
jgi:ACR3 family arsenite transporter